MTDEPTPWEDINPPMASAQPRALPSASSGQDDARKVFRNELTACLALTAPVGMTEESRGEWLAVAWDTLKHIPPDILEIGARKARQQCDHPAKIVPTIIKETAEMMQWRREAQESKQREQGRLVAPGKSICTAAEASEILKQYGLKPNPVAPDEEA